MAIPAKSSVNMKTTLMSKSGYYVFNGSCKNMAIVWKPSSKWRAIIEVKPTTQDNILNKIKTCVTNIQTGVSVCL